ncbi:TolC family protein [Silvibacterium dinghuense]|uniref:TolC family protein n=1 Tax=Silvibacterium dinghuense TaxID=1560006 RepID=A0A4Q1SJA4_9BACT|nr:TolC family protein [Silvibacterium dinghuense]RXS97721.1 TolC family protein [Silvibacterium dinghuense]GGH01435.1 transporter [Silvibacterium dinghuense]
MKALRFSGRPHPAGLAVALAALMSAGPAALGQANPNDSAQNAYVGSVQAVALSPDAKKLSLDEAIQLGIANNLALTLARENQKSATAQRQQLVNALLPNISAHAERGTHQLNLEAEGFNTALIASFLTPFGLPASEAASFPLVATVDSTVGQLNVSQALFTWEGWDVWKAAKANEKAAYYNTQSSRGLVVLNVGTAYLQALQASAQVDYAQALLKTDETLLYQAQEEHKAGTAANLDELRARVQYQTQQQTVIAEQNAFEKAKVALNREIGLDPAQKIELTDATPYSDLATMTIEEARQKAYASRQDFQSMRAQMLTAHLERQAVKHERLPSLTFSGNYGVTGVTGEVYHGTFTAMGTLSIPIFNEATFRGDRDVAVAQEEELQSQFHDLETKIDQQLRDSLLDLKTASELVKVARSNVDLATTALEQTTDRFQAGVDDNLPVVQAQSTLAQAQTQYVNSVYQFNQAKLGLARNLGIIDTQYRNYIPGNSAVPPQGGK